MFKSLLRLTKHSAIYGMGHILGRSIGFLLLPIHTNYIVPDEYAVYIYGYAFIPIIAIFYSAGLNSAQLRYYIMADDEEEKDKIFTASFIGTLFIALVLSAILFIFSDTVAQIILGSKRYSYLIQISCGILLFDALVLLLFNILRAEEKSFQFISFSIFNIVVNIILNVIFIIHFKMGIDGIFKANLISSSLTFILLLLLTKTHFSPIFSYLLLKKLLKFGLPIIPSILGMVSITVIDRFIIRKIMGNEAVGIYGAGYKLGMFMSLIVTAFRYAWHPFYLSISKEKDYAREVFSKILTYFIFLCGAIFLTISLFVDEIVRFKIMGVTVFGKEYWSGTMIVPVILASYIFYGMYINFQIGVYLKNKTNYLSLTAGLSAIINIIANFLFIPQLGLLGAAYATLISYIFMAFSLYFLVNKLYPIKYEWLRLSKIVVTCALIYIIGTLSYPDKTSMFKLVFILAYFIILYFIGFYEKIEIKTIKEIIKGSLWRN